MPVYTNPNPHPVVIAMLNPRTSLSIFPSAWPKSRLPDGARQAVELDAVLARPLIQTGMLIPDPMATKEAAKRNGSTHPVKVILNPELDDKPLNPTTERHQEPHEPQPAAKIHDKTTLIKHRKPATEAVAAVAATSTEPGDKPKRRFRVID